MGTFGVWAIQAVGDLELGLGRPAASITHHEAPAAAMRDRGIADVDLSPAPDLVDASLRLGRAPQTSELAWSYVTAAEAKGQPWALAWAARRRGLLAENTSWEDAFDQAIQLHQRTLDIFEGARTRLAWGLACAATTSDLVAARCCGRRSRPLSGSAPGLG
jgi:hypothetical protein